MLKSCLLPGSGVVVARQAGGLAVRVRFSAPRPKYVKMVKHMSWKDLPEPKLGAFNYELLDIQTLSATAVLTREVVDKPRGLQAFQIFRTSNSIGNANKTSRTVLEPAAHAAGGVEAKDWAENKRKLKEEMVLENMRQIGEQLNGDPELNSQYRAFEKGFNEIIMMAPQEFKDDPIIKQAYEAGVLNLIEIWAKNLQEESKQ